MTLCESYRARPAVGRRGRRLRRGRTLFAGAGLQARHCYDSAAVVTRPPVPGMVKLCGLPSRGPVRYHH
eukprot:750394-Hanusia_phi.AAC.4